MLVDVVVQHAHAVIYTVSLSVQFSLVAYTPYTPHSVWIVYVPLVASYDVYPPSLGPLILT